MAIGSGGDPHSDHTARRLIVQVQALVERLQQQLEHLDQRVREDTKIVRHTLTLIGDEIFQDQRRRKEQRAADEKARTEEKDRDTKQRTTRQVDLDRTLRVIQVTLLCLVIAVFVAIFLWLGARFL